MVAPLGRTAFALEETSDNEGRLPTSFSLAMPVLNPNQSYTFSRYFELRIDPIDLATYFNYKFRRSPLNLPFFIGELDRLASLSASITETIPRLVRLNEQAKREAFIFPVINTVSYYTNALMRIEYPIKISEQLQGELDYLLSVDNLQNLLVIEAKRGDLDYGFSQLTAEMIALDQWPDAPTPEQQPLLVGAVTVGDSWRFGTLDRLTQVITEDTGSYRVPEDLEPLLRLLIQVLCPQGDTKRS
jgi:hypothetical protein